MATGERFPCIVCQSLANSISELHDHQKFSHTSEELSMSVIYLVNYMCLQQNMALKWREASNHLIWPGYTANYHDQERYARTSEKASQIHGFPESQIHMQGPIDYTPSLSSYPKTETASSTKVKENEFQHCIASTSGLSRSEAQKKGRVNISSSLFASSWETELCKVEEINDDIFLQSVNGICQDLKSIVKTPELGEKQQHDGFPLVTTTDRKCHNKKSSKRKCNIQKNYHYSDPTTCYKNLVQYEDFEFQDNVTANCSSEIDGASVKLASFAQTFQHLKQRKVEFSNGVNGMNENGKFQGSTNQTLPLHREISILQEDLITADYKHELKGKVTMLGSNFYNNLME